MIYIKGYASNSGKTKRFSRQDDLSHPVQKQYRVKESRRLRREKIDPYNWDLQFDQEVTK